MSAGTRVLSGLVLVGLVAGVADAADIGVAAKKIVVVDKLASSGKAKAVFAAKDAGVTKGAGTDTSTIALDLFFGYQGTQGPASGQFVVPPGPSDGEAGWIVNKDTVAKFVNKDAPNGPTGAKVATVKPGTLIKVVGKNLGDQPIDLLGAGAPVTDLCVATIVTNAGEINRHCTLFPLETIAYKEIAGGTGRKLVAKNGLADAACGACGGGLPSTTSTTTSTSTSTTTTTSTSTSSTTSTSIAGTTTSTSSSSSSSTTTPSTTPTTTSTTTSTIIPAGCGNGTLNAGETCDDGNNSNNDGCPANCVILPCTPLAGTSRLVEVSFTPPVGVGIAGLTLILNYPEQKVFMPPAGPQTTIGAANFTPLHPPAEVLIRGADLAPAGSTGSGHAVRGIMGDDAAVPAGPIFRLNFQNCQGAAAPLAGEFNCAIVNAVDQGTNPISGVTCSASLL
jgi:cysteine-rich repeat protein